jgi:hypothetical protein
MEYAKKKNVVLINSPDSATECLMRTLINYAIIYSLGSNKFGKEKVNGFKNDCGPFASFTL